MNYEIQALQKRLDKIVTLNEVNEETLARKSKLLKAAETRKKELEDLLVIVQQCAKRTQNKIRNRFETIVQSCLDVVFPNEYKFHFEFVDKRGKTEVEMKLEDSFGQMLDPLKSNGGGLVDVISIALRVACLTMSGKEKVLLLDECFAHIRRPAKDKLGEIMSMLSKNLGIQIIMVADTSGNTIPADREFIVNKTNNISNVTIKEKEVEDYDK